jgi:Ribbon-helix-helix protein, copG family
MTDFSTEKFDSRASFRCKVVHYCDRQQMPRKPKSEPSLRTSVTFPPDVYSSLELIAKKKKVSLAWVVRDAAEKYVADQWPLFAGRHDEK